MSGGGEKQGDREAMERVQGRLVRDGVPADRAEKEARESIRRTDRLLREQGKRS